MSEGFAAMSKLRLLKVDYAGIAGNLVQSFSELRWLSWKGCPTLFTPTNPRKLVVPDLIVSDITESWMGWNDIMLSRTLDFSANPQLEVLILEYCSNLRLVILNLRCCMRLKYLPTNICELSSLKKLDIRFTSICQFPGKIGCLEALIELYVRPCFEVQLPNSIGNLRNLKTLSPADDTTISRFSLLQKLSFYMCENLQSLPELPSSLKSLNADECKNLREISGFSNMRNLVSGSINIELIIEVCPLLRKILNLSDSINLVFIEIRGCMGKVDYKGLPSLRRIPYLLGSKNLVCIEILRCHDLSKIDGLEGLHSLEKLIIKVCPLLGKIPNLSVLINLVFDIYGCEKLSEIEGLEDLKALISFDLTHCESIGRLPDLSKLKTLEYLLISNLTMLLKVGCLEGLKSLEELKIYKAPSLKVLPNISTLKNLKGLELQLCGKGRSQVLTSWSDWKYWKYWKCVGANQWKDYQICQT
ncbi:hypothetical protein NE237_026066 [Protea cynaroides]|uniref:Disease resistance R13L4/SHOC-2-like LRR domain-containing protein n=1 Tax=Protea cynaroides TaxID=273540 RepID=A0A9Q0K1X4_9MAGN|nr:hypothetical protein NE237_026066 [Protea cynaroides]